MTVIYPVQMDILPFAKRKEASKRKKRDSLSYVTKKKSHYLRSLEHESNQRPHVELDEPTLRQIVEELRVQLHELVSLKGLSDHSVVRLSQELDSYIVRLQRIKLRRPPVL
jgi:hypothetical protein